VRLSIDFHELCGIEVRIPLRGAEPRVAEQLLNDAALEAPGADRATRLDVLDRRLRDGAAFLLNLPMRFAFERRVYEARAAAELLGISPRVMNYKIKTLGIEFPRGRRPMVAAAS